MTKELHSAVRWLHDYGHRYPDAWEQYARFLAAPPTAWPEWCFCPLAGAYAILSEGGRIATERAADVAPLGGMAAWRATQGIYRIYPTLLDELLHTPIDGEIPADVLFRLPEWCVYVETQGLEELAGFFAFLEHDANNGRVELRLLLDFVEPRFLATQIVHLGRGTLRAGFGAALELAMDNARKHGKDADALQIAEGAVHADLSRLERLVSVLLYLCADESDVPVRQALPPKVVKGKRRPIMPTPKRGPSVHHCGIRIGAQLDLARAAHTARSQVAGTTVQPHIRRAHWHTYWRGPRDGERSTIVRWLPPIAVNLDGAPEIAVVRPVGRDLEN